MKKRKHWVFKNASRSLDICPNFFSFLRLPETVLKFQMMPACQTPCVSLSFPHCDKWMDCLSEVKPISASKSLIVEISIACKRSHNWAVKAEMHWSNNNNNISAVTDWFWPNFKYLFLGLTTKQDLGLKCSAWEVFGYK